jgi:excisionase family DNA binding protein
MFGSSQLTLDAIPEATRRRRYASRRAPATLSAPDGPPAPARVALSVDEAAAALGVSRDHFDRHVLGGLRVIYSGRRRLIPVRELERWADREAVAIPSRVR